MRACAIAIAAAVGWLSEGCSCTGNPAGPDGGHSCSPACPSGTACRYGACVPPPTACTTNLDCPGDQYCDRAAGECLPWGVGPGGDRDPECKRAPVPGVFFPGAQCEWLGPPAGDPYPGHVNVLSTPMVATLYTQGEFATPSIVFTSYNFTDGGGQSCIGTFPNDYYGVIRVINGRSCDQQATIDLPRVVPSASVAIADLGGDPTPEIVAARLDGGLVAFTRLPAGWQVMWQTAQRFGDDYCNWAGPSIHDLDDDGVPEIIHYGGVYDAAGNVLDESRQAIVDSTGTGYIPVLADLDGNGTVEMIAGSTIYTWEPVMKRWAVQQMLPFANGHTAVADFGTFPQDLQDSRALLDGIAEIVVVHDGVAKVYSIHGRELFSGNLQAIGGTVVGRGGPPTIADFDGDGRAEFATAGASAYHVFDLDCRGAAPDPAACPSLRTDGLAWLAQSKDASSNTTGSSVFDFDGDGRAEVVYGDECFTRVYDGITGKVLYSRFRTSCTWYENPVVADVDADFNAEIVSTSNTNCAVVCPEVDPIFDGVQCLDDSDCPAATRCGREQPNDALGRCRCTADADCGGDGFVCLDPIGGFSPAGRVCRASHPPTAAATGVRVLADGVDRWTNTRAIWNQHAYAVTNIEQNGKVPRTSQWARNWTQPGLNNFRQNAPGDGLPPGAIPDLTVRQAKVTCEPAGGATVTAEVCNRGTEPVAQGLPVAVYADSAAAARCTGVTTERMFPGACTEVSCLWTGAGGDGYIAVDDRGDGTGIGLECREDNNQLAITVTCP